MVKYELPSGEIITQEELGSRIEKVRARLEIACDGISAGVKEAEACQKKGNVEAMNITIKETDTNATLYTKLKHSIWFYNKAKVVEFNFFDLCCLIKEAIWSLFG